MPIDVAALRAELKLLTDAERAALTDEPLTRKAIRMYDALGGSRVRLKQIIVTGVKVVVATELNDDDLPVIPDDVIDPQILERVGERVSAMVDNLFAGRPTLPP